MKNKKKTRNDDLVQAIGELAAKTTQLAHRAERLYAGEVEDILQSGCCDPRRIEHVLDGILDFCSDDSMLRLFKKLCRYYYQIDPAATASYVNFYREMWDEEGKK